MAFYVLPVTATKRQLLDTASLKAPHQFNTVSDDRIRVVVQAQMALWVKCRVVTVFVNTETKNATVTEQSC